MEPRATRKGDSPWVAEGECCRAVGEHCSLTIGLHHHHNAGAATAALQEWFNPSSQEGRLKGLGGGVTPHSTDEARRAPSGYGCYGNVGGAPAAPSRDLGGGIGAASPGCVKPYGDLVD
jgi:hypothetical protein